MSLYLELKRRNVFRVTIAYVIIAWLILQVGDRNKVKGKFSNTTPRGNTNDGSVDGEVNGKSVQLKVIMNGSGTEYKIDLEGDKSFLSGTRASSNDSWGHTFYKK